MTSDTNHSIFESPTTRLPRFAGAHPPGDEPASSPQAPLEQPQAGQPADAAPRNMTSDLEQETRTPPPLQPGSEPPSEAASEASMWDTFETPTHPLPVIVQPTSARLSLGARLAVLGAVVLSLIALAASAAALIPVMQARHAITSSLDNAIGAVETLCGPTGFPISIPFSQTIRFKGDVAMPDDMVIPFKGNIPINTVVRINVPGLPGSPTIEVPVNTTVPVDTQVPVPGGFTIPVDTSIPVNQEFSIDLCASGGPARNLLEQVANELRTWRSTLQSP